MALLARPDLRASLPHRVLIVSPHFPPINAADQHRARMALSYLGENGWQAEVLAVRPEDVEGVPDRDLAAALPANCVVHRIKALAAGWGNLARRAYRQLRKRGDALLATGRFDLVFFSTTQFGILPLGPDWKRRHGVPYVLDFQDEWVGDYYRDHPQIEPPGGRLKYAVSHWLARRQEPAVVREAARIVSVSHHYNVHLRVRYPELPTDRFHELPFGGSEADFTELERLAPQQRFFDPADGRKHWVYAGRGGADMSQAVEAFFLALRRAFATRVLTPDEVRVHFIGTSYAPAKRARKSFAPLAAAHELENVVTEYTSRAPYFTTLQCLRQAHALLLFGSDDAGYTASKIYPSILARRPLLALFHEESSAVKILRTTRAGTVTTFLPSQSREEMGEKIFREWLLTRAFDRAPEMEAGAFTPYSAATMTRHLGEIFLAALGQAIR
jgi:hypothetical protein